METMTAIRSIILATRAEALEHGLRITTSDGKFLIPWEECSEKLAKATTLERSILEKLPSGYGIHWPLLDEDLAVGPLVKGRKAMPPGRS